MATITGAIGNIDYKVAFISAHSQAYSVASTLVQQIDSQYQTATVYAPSTTGPHSGALIVPPGVSNTRIDVSGYSAVIVEDNSPETAGDTIVGGGDQVVIAGDAGLDFRSTTGADTVVVGGGTNVINLSGDTSSSAIYTGYGADTIYASDGNSTINVGGGTAHIYLGAGADSVQIAGTATVYGATGNTTATVTGNSYVVDLRRSTGSANLNLFGHDTLYASTGDLTASLAGGSDVVHLGAGQSSLTLFGDGDTVHLGAGDATIQATGSVQILGATSVNSGGFTLTFANGSAASTVKGGAGSYSISGGPGGGLFYGGNAGGNRIVTGTGNSTIVGAGGNNTLGGGAGSDSIVGSGPGDLISGGGGDDTLVAGTGNETLIGGSGGNDTIIGGHGNDLLIGGSGGNVFVLKTALISTQGGTVDIIKNFGFSAGNDFLQVSNKGEALYDVNHQHLVGGNPPGAGGAYNDIITMSDGTTIKVQGVDHKLTITDFKY